MWLVESGQKLVNIIIFRIHDGGKCHPWTTLGYTTYSIDEDKVGRERVGEMWVLEIMRD